MVEALFRKFNLYLGKDGDEPMVSDPNKARLGKLGNGGQGAGSNTCNHCRRTNRNYGNESKYEMHLFRECPMLINCRSCAKVIEIKRLTEHLKSECEAHERAYDFCKECNMHYLKNEFPAHQKKGNHVEVTGEGENAHQFCPLCYQELEPGDHAWIQHLVFRGCPQNERTK